MSTALVTATGPRCGERWRSAAGTVDLRVLAQAIPPVLDIGCGPGRHTLALIEAGSLALGIDLTPAAVAAARERGVPALERCVFDRVPGSGRFGSALLLDGNIGIGGDPARLLARTAELLRPHGIVVAEFDTAGGAGTPQLARLEIDDRTGPWFPWIEVDFADAAALGAAAGLRLVRRWRDTSRNFAIFERP